MPYKGLNPHGLTPKIKFQILSFETKTSYSFKILKITEKGIIKKPKSELQPPLSLKQDILSGSTYYILF